MGIDAAEAYLTREYQSVVSWIALYLASLLVQARMTPEEVVHETYFRMCRKNSVWYSEQHLANWMHRAAGHVLRDTIRRQRIRQLVWIESSQVLSERGDTGASDETAQSVNEALTTLRRSCPRQAQVISLRHLEGLTIFECAARLHISERTVKRDATNAYARLRRELAA